MRLIYGLAIGVLAALVFVGVAYLFGGIDIAVSVACGVAFAVVVSIFPKRRKLKSEVA